MLSRPQGSSQQPGWVCATTGGLPSMRRGRVLASDAPALPATAEALAPSVPVPALAVRPVVAHSSAPRAHSRDLRPTVGAPAVTVPLLAGPPTPPSALAPAPLPAASFLRAPDAPAPAPPSLAGTPAPDVAVLPPSVRPRVRFLYALVAIARSVPSIVDPSPLDIPLTAGAPEILAQALLSTCATLRAAYRAARAGRAATRNGPRQDLPTFVSPVRCEP